MPEISDITRYITVPEDAPYEIIENSEKNKDKRLKALKTALITQMTP